MKKNSIDFAEQFLALPASKLAVELEKQRRAARPKKTWRTFLNLTKKQLLAFSAFIVAIGPLYQLNISAYKRWAEREYVSKTLARADLLIAAAAMDDARIELEKVRALDSSNGKLQDLSAVLELETVLRLNQTKASLSVIEIRFAQSLHRHALAAYLLGTAYINLDLERAGQYLDEAEKINSGLDQILSVRLCAARIWICARRYDADEKPEWPEMANRLHLEGLAIIKAHPALDFASARIALDNNLGMLGSEVESEIRLNRSREAFEIALRSGNTLSTGKAAQNLAANLKDAEKLDEAKGTVLLALQHAQMAKDARGIYNCHYTHGQIQFLQEQLTDSQASFKLAAQSAITNMDYRLASLALAYLGKTWLLLNNITEGRSCLLQARVLATARHDKFGIGEANYLLELANQFEKKTAKLPWDTNGLESQLANLRAEKLDSLTRSVEYIQAGLIKTVETPKIEPGTYDAAFTKRVLKALIH
jgi:hypothetical protein